MKRRDAVKTGIAFGLTILSQDVFDSPVEAADNKSLIMVVMDPLAAPLSCPCVKGYAQRDYEKLANHLHQELKRPVTVAFSESLAKALDEQTEGRADIVIGKQSVVEFDAKAGNRRLERV